MVLWFGALGMNLEFLSVLPFAGSLGDDVK